MNNRFQQRSVNEEIMDDLLCTGAVVDQTLVELEVINRLLGGNHVTIGALDWLMKVSLLPRNMTLADLGCGGGDILKEIVRWAKFHSVHLHLTGIDANPHIVAFARNNTRAFENITYEQINIFSPEFRAMRFDVFTATLFTHHFSDEQLTSLLTSLKAQARHAIIINDIHRHWFAFHAIRLLTRFFSKSEMVKNDAPLSVLRAFRRKELLTILENAGIKQYSLRWCWAFRWQLIILTGS